MISVQKDFIQSKFRMEPVTLVSGHSDHRNRKGKSQRKKKKRKKIVFEVYH